MLDNVGDVEHDLEIVGTTPNTFKVIHTTTMGHHHSSSEIHIHSQPSQQETITFIPEESGTFKFICTIPGHKESGMSGELKVN